MATKARDVMDTNVEWINSTDTIREAAKKMADLDIGALPICGEDKRLKGMITDRDIAVKVVASGQDPDSTKVEELAQGDGETVTIGADDSVNEALDTMKDHKVRRIPVIDGHEVVGIISQGDLATSIDEEKVGELVEAISAAP